MNKKKYILLSVIALAGLTSCSSDFLDRYPKDKQTEVTAFKTSENFKTYAWGLYEYFDGFPNDGGYTPANISSEYNTDNMIYANSGGESDYAYQLKKLPATSGSWNFSYIRRVNLMLKNIDGSAMNDVDKDHWRSVGYFFRALRYFDMMVNYGDVPWIDGVLNDNDKDALYCERTPRDEVAKHILDDLKWAEEHIKAGGTGTNTINVHVVRALLSRFGLYEGTWRKYRGLKDSDVYLKASAAASEKLIGTYPAVMANYDDLYNSEELVGKTGVILARQYETDLVTHSITRVIRSSAWYVDVTKDAIDSYLCTDGRPVSTSKVYEGDKDVYAQFRNRDRRLYWTVVPPYKVKLTGAAGTSFGWEHTGNAKDREYIDYMATIGGSATGKSLPVSNYVGYQVAGFPHFRNYPNGQGFLVTHLGFYFWKYYNRHADNMALLSSTVDYLVFGIEEVMLNYAEAKFELGEFAQGIADVTINKLRVRAGIPSMKVADIDASFDLNRDQTVDPVLWEIRRERRIELLGDGFRFRDLKRWKKGDYVNKQPLGAWVKNSDFGGKLKILNGAAEGYSILFAEPDGWLDKYYLEPIPTQEIALNPKLGQNPGWEKAE